MASFRVDVNSLCGDCNNKVADKDCITCNNCENVFHVVCPSASKDTQICTKTFLSSFHLTSTNRPNFMWQCNACKTQEEIDSVATLKNMMTRMEQSHTKQINELTCLVTQLIKKVDGQTDKITGDKPPTYKPTVWDDEPGISKVKSSLLAKPNAQGQNIKPRDVRKIAADKGIPVSSVIEKNNGDLFVNLPDKASCDEISQIITETHDSTKLVKLTSRLPTVSIMNITAKDMKNDADEDLDIQEVKTHICKQNKTIEQLVSQGEQLEIVYCRPPPNGKKYYTVAARVSPTIRTALKKMKMKIYFGTSVHTVVDRFHVRRCNLCQKFGHYANQCTPDTDVVCGFCTGNHKSESCQEKDKDHTHHKCSNCQAAGLSSVGHASFWQKCPAYLVAQQKLSKTIGYDYDTLN